MQWREKTLRQFVHSLAYVKNPKSIIHASISSNSFSLPIILRLIKLTDAYDLEYDIWSGEEYVLVIGWGVSKTDIPLLCRHFPNSRDRLNLFHRIRVTKRT